MANIKSIKYVKEIRELAKAIFEGGVYPSTPEPDSVELELDTPTEFRDGTEKTATITYRTGNAKH